MSAQTSASEQPETGVGRTIFEDGLGLRIRDESGGDLVERLVVCPELMRFESALRDRMGRLANFRHVRYPRVRAVERTGSGEDQTLAVVTDAVKGHRLVSLLEAAAAEDLAIDVNAALQVARELLPALSVLHDSRAVTHGALGPERIILTPEARIAIVDHTVGLALERLRFPRSRLWREFRIAMPPSAGLPQFDQRADVAQVAMVVLALVLCRPIEVKEFPDGIRALATEAPERLGGGAARPMTASLRAWFERALPLESRRPFATALEAQIALENVVTREVAYSPRPGALRSLLRRYEELHEPGGGAAPESVRDPGSGSTSDRPATLKPGGQENRGTSATSSRRRAGTKSRKAPTADELEAQEIARLEAELARLMSLEAAGEPVVEAQPATLGKIVRFPDHSETRDDAPASPAPPAVPSPEAAFFSVPPIDEPTDEVAETTPETAPVSEDAREKESPLGEEEMAALNALLEIESQTAAPPEATLPDTVERAPAVQGERLGPSEVELEVSLDAALEALIVDALETAAVEAQVWVVEPVAVAAECAVSDAVEPECAAADAAAQDVVEPDLVEPQVEAWSLTPLSEDDAVALARQADAEAEGTTSTAEPTRDEFTRPLDFEAAPAPVALASVRPYHRRLGTRATRRSISHADMARVLALTPRIVEGDPAKALPLRRPVLRRPAALAGAPEPLGALAATATEVSAAVAVYQPTGALVAPAALVVSAPCTTEEVAWVEAVSPAEMPAPVPAETEQAFEVWVEAAAPDAPVVETGGEETAAEETAAEMVLSTEPEVDIAIETAAPVVEAVASVETPASVVEAEAEPAAEPVWAEAAVAADEAPLPELGSAAEPETTSPEETVVSAGEQTGAVEAGVTRAKRRKRRRKKVRRAEPQAETAPLPEDVTASAPAPAPVQAPAAPWLRGRGVAPVPPRSGPTVVAPQPPAPASPITVAPPWARRGREPLPVLPSTERSDAAAVPLTPPVAPLGDAFSPDKGSEPLTTAVGPDVPSPAVPVAQAPPPVRPVTEVADVEPPQEAPGRVLTFPARHPRMAVNWRRTIAASIVIMLIEGGAFATAYWYVKPREVGYLLVNSTVTGLDVSIDGKVQGKTPLSLELPPGRHTIELRGHGVTKTLPVEIAPNVQTSQMVAWSRPAKVGRLRLKTTPPGAQVMVDGQPRGQSPLAIDDLAAGPHQIVVQNDSGTVEQTVRIVADDTLEIDVPIYSGWLALFAPVEVRIFEDGKLLGTSLDGRILMAPGRHRLELVNQRLGLRQTRDIVIQPGRVLAVSVDAPRGTLVVEAPSGTSVSVDGVAMGVTPLGELSVEVGTREILFQHPELGQRRVTITVGVGAPARANMLAPR